MKTAAGTLSAASGELARSAPSTLGSGVHHAPKPPLVCFRDVTKTYDGLKPVLKCLNLSIFEGEFLTLLGPSGSGKTTTLSLLAGFDTPTGGAIEIAGRNVNAIPAHKRDIGVVFQNYALFPHMTVADNVGFPLKVRNVPADEVRRRVADALDLVQLGGFADRRPRQMSGGQQQRIAVARALIFNPKIVLMDEPLGALDKRLREEIQIELKRIHRRSGVTFLYVTHDQGEALTMSDRVAVFSDGEVQQIGSPFEIYDRPSNLFVATFVGENNVLPGTLVSVGDGQHEIEVPGIGRLRAQAGCDAKPGSSLKICVRPEALRIADEAGASLNSITGQITDITFYGDYLRVTFDAQGHSLSAKLPRERRLAEGDIVRLSFRPEDSRALA